jgi:NADPH:quinone reductase-like Zn-dependent oxidoreductase
MSCADNVGGKVLEDALTASRNNGRIVACGQISTYDAPEEKRYGVRNLFYVSAAVLACSRDGCACPFEFESLQRRQAVLGCAHVAAQ